MSDILFNPNTKSNILHKDVLNIIGTYVVHPLADIIKKEVRYTEYFDSVWGISTIRFKNKTFTYSQLCFKVDGVYEDYGYTYRSGLHFPRNLGHDFPISYIMHPNFEIHQENGCYWLKNIIPMHKDTFYFMYNFLRNLKND